MEMVKGDVIAPVGFTGQGTVFAINHNADNALIALRYVLKSANIPAAEEPFERAAPSSSGGRSSSRAWARRTREGHDGPGPGRAGARCRCRRWKMHPARAAARGDSPPVECDADRGLVAQAVDLYKRAVRLHRPGDGRQDGQPPREVRRDRVWPGRGSGAVEGTPLWKNPIPWSQAAACQRRGVGADRGHADRHGSRGAHAPPRLHQRGRRLHWLQQQRRVRHHEQLRVWRQRQPRRGHDARGRSLLRTKIVD